MKRLTIGGVWPDDAWVDRDKQAMCADFARYLPADADLVTASHPVLPGPNTVTLGRAIADGGTVEEAARRVLRYRPDGIAYYCTTISFVRGPGGDRRLADAIFSATGLPATTTSTAMIAALQALDVRRISVASPYLPDVEAMFVSFIEDHGVAVVASESMHLPDDHSIVPPQAMAEMAVAADRPDAQAIFIGCSGQRLAGRLARIEQEVGKPVLSANQVTGWHMLRILGRTERIPRLGALADVRLAHAAEPLAAT